MTQMTKVYTVEKVLGKESDNVISIGKNELGEHLVSATMPDMKWKGLIWNTLVNTITKSKLKELEISGEYTAFLLRAGWDWGVMTYINMSEDPSGKSFGCRER